MNNPARLISTRGLRIACEARALTPETTQKTAFLTTPEALRVPARARRLGSRRLTGAGEGT